MRHGAANAGIRKHGMRLVESQFADIVDGAA
jgi:hypothetical protein